MTALSRRKNGSRCSNREPPSPVTSIATDARTSSLAAEFSPFSLPTPRGDSFPSLPSQARRTEWPRSEEHTSELQSRLHLVCRLLLEKKKRRELRLRVSRMTL